MKTVMVRYKVRSDKVSENEALIREVFEELRRLQPAGLQYRSYKMDDGATFVHLATIDTADGRNPLTELASFKRFVRDIDERCVEEPAPAELSQVGGYDGLRAAV
jgi:hypothetical protein